MKKIRKTKKEPVMKPEYDFRGGVRGKYAARYARGTNVIILDPDVARVFKDSKAVNKALRALAKLSARRSNQVSE